MTKINQKIPIICRCGLKLIEIDKTDQEEFNSFTNKRYILKERFCPKFRSFLGGLLHNFGSHDFYNFSSRCSLGWTSYKYMDSEV